MRSCNLLASPRVETYNKISFRNSLAEENEIYAVDIEPHGIKPKIYMNFSAVREHIISQALTIAFAR